MFINDACPHLLIKKYFSLLFMVWLCIFWEHSVQAENRWAVIIGIEEYQDPRLNLEYTQDDAEAIYQILRTIGDIPEQNILFLLNEQATRDSISEAFRDWLPNRVEPDDFVVIYYTGHGVQGPDLEPEDEGDSKDEYLVPYDIDISSVDTLGTSGVRDDLLSEWLGKLLSDTVVIFDATYSGVGNMQEEFPGLSEHISILASCQPYQQACEYPELKHGIFTYYLTKGLQGEADQNSDGQILVSEAFAYTEQHMANDARISGLKQQPVIWMKKDHVLVTVLEKIHIDLWFDILEADGTETRGVEGGEYQSGATIKLSFQVAQDCYLFVFNIDQNGQVYNFHPLDAEADESVQVEKDRIYTVETRLDDVVGEECFYAVASWQSFSLSRDVLPAVNKMFQTKGLQLEPMKELDVPLKELDIPFSYKIICFKHR